ncbi:TetR/AcrR family transcriptional regulator C-terminal domain-containing protein [Streptomyces justiciae]|uniref:TetR/AcrR family transcriptional regulator C-terminal domain-containing protein n=1 Tax=Streptomyces justiciae TaxID=2780140 RepID=A0ABU3M5Q0_9ACTN|nr:TetR/AcrR family transcriptional regulator C-terminal domain-containing protein [Streptomyces justiciae]MBE8475571.1 TetR/AcrR family transcriptional regulator C-terminal domain-containing protein [Streptomyces justiciae]MCW8382490.1 TetR/AcrR family transcriptional regulator C-terminal domain-containing protein [Streptomyces justiciae]MDT7846683.1 TetR/AcrR family transcriptional regulator C-terminal domain-containing protein [Streptomyces justiciae]
MPLERIVSTALQIVDEEGADALSMRTLAQRLGSGTATLYRHFDNRAALIAHVVDRMFGAVELNGDELRAMGWQQAVRTAAHTMFDALSRHQNAARLMVEQVPLGPKAMAMRERCVAVLLDNGFRPRQAAHAYATLARYVLGFAVQVNRQEGAGQSDDAQAAAVFQSVDPDLFPATLTVASEMPIPLEEEFSFGLELLVSGLERLRDE